MSARPIDNVLARLEGVRRGADGQHSAKCPAHEDKFASLSVAETDTGRVLMYCHAGCTYDHVSSALGLRAGDTRGDASLPPPTRQERKATTYTSAMAAAFTAAERVDAEIGGEWSYRGADGSVAFLLYRLNHKGGRGKSYRPVYKTDNGWVSSFPAGPRPVYGLPDILRDRHSTIFVCEGEKAAAAASALGLLGTTSVGGANAEHKTDWSPLAGREVIILPDNDEAGREYAAAVAKILRELSPPARVRIVELPGLPDKGDIVEFIEAHGNQAHARILDLIREPVSLVPKHTSLIDIMRDREFAAGCTADVAIANCLVEDIAAARGGVAPVVARGSVFAYDGRAGTWQEFDRAAMESMAQDYDGCSIVSEDKNGEVVTKRLGLTAGKVEGIAKSVLRCSNIIKRQFFEDAPDGIAFANGLVRVSADGLSLAPKSPENRALAALAYDYSEDAECPEWTAVVRRVFERDQDAEDKRKLLQEFVGACLAGIAFRYAKCLVLTGAGDNGKNVVTDTIERHLFPPSAIQKVAPHQWHKHEFLAALRGVRLNISSELPAHEMQSTEIFKAVVDGNSVTTRNMYKDPFTFTPRCGHIFNANNLPGTRDHSDGYWRRFLVLAFNRNFKMDPDETGELRTKEAVLEILAREAPGIALWALHGAVRLMRQGKYTAPASHAQELHDWRMSTDPVASFIEQCCALDDAGELLGDIYRACVQWLEQNGHKQITSETLAARLRGLGIKRLGKSNRGAKYAIRVQERPMWGVVGGQSCLQLVK